MSSLVTSASIWTNDSPNKKRTSSIRKTFKLKSEPKPIDELNEMGEDYVSEKENYQNMMASSMDDTRDVQNDRANRVNDILNKITAVESNETNKMGSFKPMPNPSYELKKDVNDHSMILGSMPLNYEMPSYSQAGSSFKKTDDRFSSNIDNGDISYSNYQRSYDPSTIYYKPNIAGRSTNATATPHHQMDSKLMEKINYMIRLLEEQQMEKTSNITEEFILYSFLGVFIIFIVDSFSRSGKYTR